MNTTLLENGRKMENILVTCEQNDCYIVGVCMHTYVCVCTVCIHIVFHLRMPEGFSNRSSKILEVWDKASDCMTRILGPWEFLYSIHTSLPYCGDWLHSTKQQNQSGSHVQILALSEEVLVC